MEMSEAEPQRKGMAKRRLSRRPKPSILKLTPGHTGQAAMMEISILCSHQPQFHEHVSGITHPLLSLVFFLPLSHPQ
jgi:hypothetical protein